jgi:hypothetical protein
VMAVVKAQRLPRRCQMSMFLYDFGRRVEFVACADNHRRETWESRKATCCGYVVEAHC